MLSATSVRRVMAALLALALIAVLGVPLASAQEGGEPRTIVDFVGRQVTLETPPQRIVGMSASISEMLFAIGVKPVGVTAGMDYPPEAASLPNVGTGYQPNLETLAALEPDLIIGNAQLNMSILDKMEAIAPTIMVMTMTANDVPQNVRLLGQATWHDTEAEYLARAYDGYLALADKIGTSHEGPSIVFIVGTLDVPNYGKSTTYFGDMAKRLGATNIADSEADAGPFPGYAQLSVEAIVDADPDFVFTVTRGAPTPMPETMASDPIWSSLSAFQNARVIELDNRLFVESPGPRFIEAMAQLLDIFYGEGME
ncbi:MAG: ABC transporter substrate-binding protein [Anaerolineae bacterium]|nr:ABC transporter substrate-binding protein [Anaerolineae bacterium]